ncbi:hypothetical protein [Leptolyngbya ohadii]|uniref:hypothetical protein n=1 Tax=Leptolyngbya ohadii TaxID=1962290 RepID=UPI000B5A0192|nr:hypothetical protein [Leptolyngbya ohadii]
MNPNLEGAIDAVPLTLYHQTDLPTDFAPSTWVRLATSLSPFSHEEAMLLCQASSEEWIAWVPDYGEVVLHLSEFYLPTEWN